VESCPLEDARPSRPAFPPTGRWWEGLQRLNRVVHAVSSRQYGLLSCGRLGCAQVDERLMVCQWCGVLSHYEGSLGLRGQRRRGCSAFRREWGWRGVL